MNFISEVLRSYGFEYVDYVYEPGQYAVRGSIIDVFSFSSEYPFRIDFFGDEVESLRTFEVDSQLSKEKKESIVIVPDLSRSLEQGGTGGMVSFLDFLHPDTVLAMRDFLWLRERIQAVHDESLTPQAIAAREAEENGAISLEGKLADAGEFTVRALDFRRLEFGVHRYAGCRCLFQDYRPTHLPQELRSGGECFQGVSFTRIRPVYM